MVKKHALLSASKAARWLKCPPSARLEEQLPDKTSSYADEGTDAHELAELAARYWLGVISEVEYEKAKAEFIAKSQYYNQEMDDCSIAYAKLVHAKLQEVHQSCPDPYAELEAPVSFTKWVPRGAGTCDLLIVADGILEIVDYKYGKGVPVAAENNPQMRLYALGAYAEFSQLFDIKLVRMTIFQPRLREEPSTEMITVEELLAWANDVRKIAKLAYNGQGEFNPGEDTCKFCKAKEQCRARTEHNLKLFDDAPKELITPNEAGEILKKAADMRAWLTDLENLVFGTLNNGETVDGWKLVEGRSNRKYIDEQQIIETLKTAGYDENDFMEHSLLSITNLEKILGRKVVAEVIGGLIEKPSGKPTLAPDTDPRMTYQRSEQLIKEFDN